MKTATKFHLCCPFGRTTRNEGETPVISSIGLSTEIKHRVPDFFDKVLGTSVFGASGQQVLPTDDEETARRKIEDEIRRHSNVFEWNDDGSLTVTRQLTLIRIHKETGLTTCFGNVTSAWGRSTHRGATEPPFRGDDNSITRRRNTSTENRLKRGIWT
ncbi:hypothetical protein HYQ45_011970 [Verticillium longisporum]|uniref:Uncharacterized protein n=1 Tax=Verticillium longisporum TaxID=100787 RepID=A0A8I2ZFI2_VERLO|nr:hypothetical protein HYQ44_007606 [Verticillium longisporum]KAG7128386.1 hypothetical protein HYQ45_011970 [Verticillium longisporum]KAG7153096.1 hypothetical protein HYQ46_013142 [Verticillium longisporum]